MSNTEIGGSDGDDEISLSEIIDFFAKQWQFILGLSLLGAALGTGYSLLSTPRYQASGQIQVGKVANIEVETSAMLMAKLAMPSYFSNETLKACEVAHHVDPGEVLLKKISAVLNKTAPIVTITLKTTEPKVAKLCIESILEDIRKNESENTAAIVNVKKNQIQGFRQRLEVAENLAASFTKIYPGKAPQYNFDDEKFSAAGLLFATSSLKQYELKDLRNHINELEFMLQAPQTKEADLVVPIYVSSIPVGPSTPVLALLAALVAGMLAVIYLVGRNMVRRSKSV